MNELSGIKIPVWGRTGIRAFAKVSRRDFALLRRYRWHCTKGNAARAIKHKGKVIRIYMHREVLGPYGPGIECDHINRNQLDNRRENLRLVTHAENLQNRSSTRGRKLPRGVYLSRGKVWIAQVKVRGRRFRRRCGSLEEASDAAAQLRRELMPYSQDAVGQR